MVFSEHIFLFVFLPACLLTFYALRRVRLYRASVVALVLFSFVFYGYWSLPYLGLLIGSIAVNYLLGRYLWRAERGRFASRAAMWSGVAFNLGLIVWFKYAGFLTVDVAGFKSFEDVFAGIILPIGISFFTFQQVAYVVDAYAKRSYEPSLLNYALFISFFPQLIAGPVVNHKYVEDQYRELAAGTLDRKIFRFGILLFTIGLAKKVVIADVIGRQIDPMFDATLDGGQVEMVRSWLMVTAYRLQLYFDFSGYSDMAIGLAALFGLRLPINFNSPYKARSIIELWGRWHMSLSAFIRDYVYIPLGGSRHGKIKQIRNIFIGMFLIGIWHGAAWTFVWYALMMASAVCLNHAVRAWWPAFAEWNTVPAVVLKWALAIGFYFITGAFFRAENMDSALAVFGGLFGLGSGPEIIFGSVDPLLLVWCAGAMAIALLFPNSLQITRYTAELGEEWPANMGEWVDPKRQRRYDYVRPIPYKLENHTWVPVLCGLVIAICVAAGWQPAIFIYFNF
ncbi:MBOAT family O-acyltransferase [Qingshengfaniella alkalisoli]|uniref:Probable alginate O-acetylase AlgI n=1 Tax=Qingshengfaniella alkalisoli TaxID=2599296 RepID=A0A5B8J9Q7_9RHOB|nr:MBOAT family O-acyltransferase [Qingshengfaniella alkalisoli]QDY70960.1 MBOAT family protein [Qingshengfaniella alkalisoli]